jgi:hypothetical protein
MSGTKRVPISRQHASSIAMVLPLFQHALRARAKWKRSGSDEDRAAAIEAEKVIERALTIRMWQVSIFDIDSIYGRSKPPEEPRHRDDWARALGLLQQLEAADREFRRQERAARRQRKVEPQPQPEPEPA